jgi:Carboxypeptidase regulatory-like domain/TonB-dependent Receptor Plug Domain/TonB dependent receptor
MKSGYRFTLVLSVCLLLLAPIVVAQTTGTIDGTVTDQNGGALPGVTVEITSPNLQGTRVATTGNDGRYRFVSVPPGQYKVTANLSGMGTAQKNATVQLDSTATVNLQMQVSAKEAITVTGEAPLVDTASTTTGTNYTAKVMDKLPLGRNYASIVLSQPGVQTDIGETQGRSLALSVYGSTSSENLFLIDGVNTTNVIKGFQGKNINGEFIQEVEVKTGGYQAEYGRNTGGVVNVITKSGGNEFHGDVFGYFDNQSLRANQDLNLAPDNSQSGDAQASATLPRNERKEGGVDLGGFFWKDRIWFYAAYDRVNTDQQIEPAQGVNAGKQFPIKFTSNLFAGKLTFNVAQGTTLVGTLFSDPQVQEGALVVPQGTNPNTYNGRRDVGGADYAGRLNQLFGSFGILTAQYSFHKDRFNTKPQGLDVPQLQDFTPSVVGNPTVSKDGFGSIFGPTRNNASERKQYAGTFTGYLGNQEFKVGGDYQKDVTFGSTFYTGGVRQRVRPCTQIGSSTCDLSKAPFYTTPQGTSIQVFWEHDYFTPSGTDLTPLAAAPFNTPTNRTGAFVQDQWRIIPSLTVNAGVRWDREIVRKGNNEVAMDLKDEWAPRFGFVWDFVGDGTSKLYGSAGRFYYALPTDLNVRVFTANTQVATYNYSQTDLTTQDPKAPRARFIQVGSFAGEPVDTGVKAAYQDELTLGVEKALDPTFSVGIKGTYRTLGRTIEDRCDLDYTSPLTDFNSCALFNPGGSGPAASGLLPGHSGSENPTLPTTCTSDHPDSCFGLPGFAVGDAKRIFRGIEVTARKSFSQALWAQASYLYSTLRGNYSGAIREASGQTDPGINADYDYHEFTFNGYGNLELDRPHQFRLDTVYNTPFGLSVGLQAYVRSGHPTSRLGYYNSSYPDLLYLDTRGTAGRTPTDYEANLSLAYNLKVGPVTVTPQVYVFNVLNRQTVNNINEAFNVNGSFVTNPKSPFYGQAGVEPGTPRPDGTICTDTKPCSDNPDYRKALGLTATDLGRTDPRLIRFALKISF